MSSALQQQDTRFCNKARSSLERETRAVDKKNQEKKIKNFLNDFLGEASLFAASAPPRLVHESTRCMRWTLSLRSRNKRTTRSILLKTGREPDGCSSLWAA